jgi:putative phage-type endonuclease
MIISGNCEIKSVSTDLTREEWLEVRQTGLGGSDASVVLGVNKWNTPFALWAEKRGEVVSSFDGNEATRWGNRLERSVAEEYAERTGASVVAVPVTLASKKRAWQLANVDFFISKDEGSFGIYPAGKITDIDPAQLDYVHIEAILEIKTNGLTGRASREWDDDGVPSSYYWQGAHYCAVTGLRDVVFAALIGGQGLQVRNRTYTEAQIDKLNEAESKFWAMVESGEKPDMTGGEQDFEALSALYPTHVEGQVVQINEFDVDVFAEYYQAKSDADLAGERVAKLRAQIELLIGNAEAVEFDGKVLATFKATKSSETFDTKSFKEAHPELVKQFMKAKAGYRVLRVKESE